LSAIGSAIAAVIVGGIVAGKLGAPLNSVTLLGAAVIGAAPQIVRLARGQWAARGPELAAALAALVAVVGVSLYAAWPALLPVGGSGDAVLHTIHANWIARTEALPQNDEETWEYLGEMAVYPPGPALMFVAAAALAGRAPLEVMFPTITWYSGLSAALVVLLAIAASGKPISWRVTPLALVAPLLILSHRNYTLNAYLDQSYYPMALGLLLVLLAGAWLIIEPRLSLVGVAQLGLVITALVGTYPIWSAVPMGFAAIVLLFRRVSWAVRMRDLAIALGPGLALFVLVMLPRLSTGLALLEHEGFVAYPSPADLIVPLLALPALPFLVRMRNGWKLPAMIGVALGEMLGLWLAGRSGAVAGYHAVKTLFIITPLAAAIVGAALINLASLRRLPLRVAGLGAAAVTLAATGSFNPLPRNVEQPVNADMVAAARWLQEKDPRAARRAVAVGGKPGAQPYWLQVGLLGQPRDDKRTALLATAPPTPESWIFDEQLPDIAVALDLDEPPPSAQIEARFGRVAVVRRNEPDMATMNPLLIRYRTFWEDKRLKTAVELLQPIAGRLPLLELRLYQGGAPVTTFALQPEPERTRVQYLGADVIPETLSGKGYINSSAYPRFEPPVTAPTGAYSLTLRLALNGSALDERLLATFERTSVGQLERLAPHSGELIYVRRSSDGSAFTPRSLLFEQNLELTGWSGPARATPGETIEVGLVWRANQTLDQSLMTTVQLIDGAGRLVADGTAFPQDGFYPTWRWRAGEEVGERRRLWVPLDVAPGAYRLVVRVRNPATGREWAADDDGQLGELTIEQGTSGAFSSKRLETRD
jgi:hypothetical protein